MLAANAPSDSPILLKRKWKYAHGKPFLLVAFLGLSYGKEDSLTDRSILSGF